MKIALLAPSGAGKTVYLTGLYGELMNVLSHSKYGVDFQVTDPVKNSYLDQRYTKLLDQGDFGNPSDQMVKYPVSLSARDSERNLKSMHAQIIDFPGETLHRASQEKKDEVEEIIKELSECDGFIVLLDGQELITYSEQRNARGLTNKLKSKAISDILGTALSRRRTRLSNTLLDADAYAFSSGYTPIAFALTKGDLVEKWLESDPARTIRSIERTVRDVFSLKADLGGTYAEREGVIANFIRSQFGGIIDAPDVVSMRTCVSVYNEQRQRVEPKNIEHLLQFVIFTGLRNAQAEYDRRFELWLSEENSRKGVFSSAQGRSERANQSVSEYDDLGFWATLREEIFGESGSERNSRASKAFEEASKAEGAYHASSAVRGRAHQNRVTAELLSQRVLSDRLVYLLENGTGQSAFYHQNLPIALLSREKWWKEKCKAGEQLIYQDNQPKANLE